MNNFVLHFLAGVFLNFMPCVWPVLSFKLYNIVKYSQTDKNKKNLRLISLASTLGIVFIFMIFAIITITFKYTGQSFRLGFHFQNPYFLIIIIFALFLFFLNSLNFFHLDYPPRVINFIQRRYENAVKFKIGIFFENFITAIFMVLFSLPCCMPVFASIATLSLLNENNILIFFSFITTALGMALPFLIIQFKPTLFDFLKGKNYLLKLANGLISISLFGIITWLLYVLTIEIGIKSIIILMLFIAIIPIQFKIVKKRLYNLILIIFICIFGTILPISFYKEQKAVKISSELWKNDISIENINDYVNDGKTIFVNITAGWCMVCNINEITVMSDYDIVNFLNKLDVKTIKIDLTKNNKQAEYFFKNRENFGVPTYIIYNKKCSDGYRFNGQLTKRKFFEKFKHCL